MAPKSWVESLARGRAGQGRPAPVALLGVLLMIAARLSAPNPGIFRILQGQRIEIGQLVIAKSGVFVPPGTRGCVIMLRDPQREWSSQDRWRGDPYTSVLFAFLRQYLSEEYILRHLELVEVYRAPALAGVATISFRLRYGDDLAFTVEASGDPGTPEFISGKARVAVGRVEAYAGPLAEYAIGVGKKKAREILAALGATTIALPGTRRGKDIELWVQDYYQRSDPRPRKLGVFWIGGITSEESMDWYWIGAQDGAFKVTPRLLPH